MKSVGGPHAARGTRLGQHCSMRMKEQYDNIKIVLERLQYHDHGWVICFDLKMVNFLLGQQGGYIKYHCFLCYWDIRSTVDHWMKKNWPPRNSSTPCDKAPYRLNLDKSKIVDKEIEDLLAQGIIEKSDSAWVAPILLLQNPDGSSRLCTDFRKLDAVTITDQFPMPRA